MKKLFTLAALIGSILATNAQSLKMGSAKAIMAPDPNAFLRKQIQSRPQLANKTANNYGTIVDTLRYFYNKHDFINLPNNLPSVQDHYFNAVYGYAVGTSTGQALTEFGCAYLNGAGTAATSAQVTISGGIVLASVHSNHPNPTDTVTIPIRLYLYTANSGGAPIAKIDSVDGTIVDTLGYFYYLNFATPKTVSGSFFMSYRVMPRVVTDTLIVFESGAYTFTASGVPTSKRYGEGLGYTRIEQGGTTPQSVMLVNTNLFLPQGTDLEPQIYPMVSFSMSADYTLPATNSTLAPTGDYCTLKSIGFTNLSTSPVIYNKQFNFNKFITYWGSVTGFSNSVVPNPADPIVRWEFTDNAVTTLTTTNAAHTTSVAGQLSTLLTISYRPGGFGSLHQDTSLTDTQSGTYNLVSCVTTGIHEISGFESLNIYPNPTVNGKTVISGLNGVNTIFVFDILGQQVSNLSSDKETVSIDLLNKSNGTYIVKIVNANNDAKVMRIVNQN